jgi:hypothetical protein
MGHPSIQISYPLGQRQVNSWQRRAPIKVWKTGFDKPDVHFDVLVDKK